MVQIDIRNGEKIKTGYSGFVSFEYDKNIVNIIKNLPFRMYHPDTHEWEIPVRDVNDLAEMLGRYGVQITGEIEKVLDHVSNENNPIPENFKFKTQPYEHQMVGFKYGLTHNNWFLGDQMGLGKTKQVIDIAVARKLKYGYKHCLIVCGVNTLKWNWVNEIHTHSDEQCRILGQKVVGPDKIKIGSMTDKIKDLDKMISGDFDLPEYFLITNVESFRNEDFAKRIQVLCRENKINMCAADEMHKMKNPTAQQTKGFLKCNPKCKIAMTGTPLMNTPLDLYIILKWLGFETHSMYAFKNHYCIMGGFGGYEVVGYRNLDQLTTQVSCIMLRRLKEEVFDLPDKTYIDEFVDMTPKQEIIYKEVESDIKANIDMIQFDNNPLASLIRLRQATGYTGILSSTIQESAKLDRLEELVDEAISNNTKVIIFSNWTQMTDIIYERLSKYFPALITGATNDNIRQDLVDEFQNDANCKIIIGTIGAMGTGLTLTAGTVIIFVDEPWNKALFDQAVDRAHRIGTTNNITIYSLMCKGTIDERIHNLIYKKGAISDAIIDGRIVGNKREVFNYLLG